MAYLRMHCTSDIFDFMLSVGSYYNGAINKNSDNPYYLDSDGNYRQEYSSRLFFNNKINYFYKQTLNDSEVNIENDTCAN